MRSRRFWMTTKKRKRHTPEQIVRKLRDADAMLNAGQNMTAVLQTLEATSRGRQCWFHTTDYKRSHCLRILLVLWYFRLFEYVSFLLYRKWSAFHHSHNRFRTYPNWISLGRSRYALSGFHDLRRTNKGSRNQTWSTQSNRDCPNKTRANRSKQKTECEAERSEWTIDFDK